MDATAANDWLSGVLEQVRHSTAMLLPPDATPSPALVGVILLAAGGLLGIFGARYARGAVSAVLGGIGLAVGATASGVFDFPKPAGAIIGALVLSALGYYTFRLWVGIAVGLLASTVGLVAYGHDTLWPEFLAFEPYAQVQAAPEFEYTLPPSADQQALQNPELFGYLRNFYDHIKVSKPELSQNSTILWLLCLAAGFAFGAFATRWALIISCAVAGTALFGASLAALAEAFAPSGWEARVTQHPKATLAFVSVTLLLSLLVQFRLSQRPSTAASAAGGGGG